MNFLSISQKNLKLKQKMQRITDNENNQDLSTVIIPLNPKI